MERIRVLLVDDHPVVREGLKVMLATDEGLELVGQAGDGAEAVEKVAQLDPDVVLMDLRMPNLDGIEATRRIKEQWPTTAVVVLTMYDNDAYVIDAVRAGAAGYLLKDVSRDLLAFTIRAVRSGGTLVKSTLLQEAITGLVQSAMGRPQGNDGAARLLGELTARELQVLKLVAQGHTNKEIGKELCITEDTVKRHVQSIIAKLGVSDRTQAATRAALAGLLTGEG